MNPNPLTILAVVILIIIGVSLLIFNLMRLVDVYYRHIKKVDLSGDGKKDE